MRKGKKRRARIFEREMDSNGECTRNGGTIERVNDEQKTRKAGGGRTSDDLTSA